MGDLISRSGVMKILTDLELQNGTFTDAKIKLREQPTAYDLDKVVEELQVEKKKPWIVLAERNGYARAIDIVKRGGIDE